jgi:ABC-2 type transport system permease protein
VAQLLHYRPWRGSFHPPSYSIWPIARLSLALLFRRKLFWVLYGLALFIFLMFFFGQYLLFFAETQADERIRILGMSLDTRSVIHRLRKGLHLDASARMYLNLFWFQGYMVMAVLALAGAILVGNDIRHGSLPFYLSKPVSARHYLVGKCLAIGVFVTLMTTLPALCLYLQYGLLSGEDYFSTSRDLLAGILAYGLLLAAFLSLALVTAAVAVRRTVPLIMVWTTCFFFFRRLTVALVDRLHYDPRWKLLDLWNDLYLVGNGLLGGDIQRTWRQPHLFEAAAVLGGVSLLCLTYLIRRIRAVEVVS